MKNTLGAKIAVSFLLCSLGRSLEAYYTLDSAHSLIFLPKPGNTISLASPVIAGIAVDTMRQPIANRWVKVYVDDSLVGTVKTDAHGVWSYKLTSAQQLKAGSHAVKADVVLSPAHNYWTWIKEEHFFVQATDNQKADKSGKVNAANSAIVLPFNGSSINTNNHPLVVNVVDAQGNPISGETVTLKIDGSALASSSSNDNGIASYMATSLSDALHTAQAHCTQSSVSLAPVSFTIDTTHPDAPVIISPTQNQALSTNQVTINGKAQPHAMIIVYVNTQSSAGTTYADESGNWSILYTLDKGSHNIVAQAVDAADNESPFSTAIDFTVNT